MFYVGNYMTSISTLYIMIKLLFLLCELKAAVEAHQCFIVQLHAICNTIWRH